MIFGEKCARQSLFLKVNAEFSEDRHGAYWVQTVAPAITCPVVQIVRHFVMTRSLSVLRR